MTEPRILEPSRVGRSGGEPVADVLNRAADLIEQRGWWNGRGGIDLRGGECAATAMEAASGGDISRWVEAQHAFEWYLGVPPHHTAAWNDVQADGTAVVAALRAAALTYSTTTTSVVPEKQLSGSSTAARSGGERL